jgi:stage III sporulation protein AG
LDIRKQLINLVKEYKYVALILAIGILLMLLPEKQEMPDSAPVQSSEGNLQAQLEEILSQIRGVGKVRVLLTVESGERTLYIRDEDRSESSENSQTRSQAVIITDSDRAQQGLISQVLPPSYLGAVIVCQGGDQPEVKLAVVEAVCDAAGLTADKISVLKMK